MGKKIAAHPAAVFFLIKRRENEKSFVVWVYNTTYLKTFQYYSLTKMSK